jgi:protein-S-isoprenylcysteine O-methyltransferase Ste14
MRAIDLIIGVGWIVFCVYWLVVAAYFVFSAVVEERTMGKLFPAAYPPYKRATKMLIPYIL